MVPTLRPGDRVLVDLLAYRDRPPSAGDLVVASDPSDPARWLVKRVAVVGPGSAAISVPSPLTPEEWPRVPVPPGTVFLLSDNLTEGRDGRWFGPVGIGSLRGQVWYRFAPWEDRGRLVSAAPTPDNV